ncbi:hypothetical protein DCM91_16405 [Chitinophaga costaii]|nr:hypothetical protein DCM91_16405 [Chitinophaga costaii]
MHVLLFLKWFVTIWYQSSGWLLVHRLTLQKNDFKRAVLLGRVGTTALYSLQDKQLQGIK